MDLQRFNSDKKDDSLIHGESEENAENRLTKSEQAALFGYFFSLNFFIHKSKNEHRGDQFIRLPKWSWISNDCDVRGCLGKKQ